MSSDEGLVGYVPYLRRFARALTGSQTLGDACVVGPSNASWQGKRPIFPPASPCTVPSWRRSMHSSRVRCRVGAMSKVRSVQRNLAALTPWGARHSCW